MSVQLVLALGLNAPPHSFTNYVPGDNQAVCQAIRRVVQGKGQNCLYLCGGSGLGKTHLLQAACHDVSCNGGTPVYLPLAQMRQYSIDVVEGLDALDLVCLDDIHGIAGIDNWEHAVFSLFNRLYETHTPLLVSGETIPTHLRLHLKDLVSRLSWGGVFPLHPLGEAEQRIVLKKHAMSLGLQLPDAVITYLIRHCAPDIKSLIYWVEYIDKASLAAKRRITVPFIRSLMKSEVVGAI